MYTKLKAINDNGCG